MRTWNRVLMALALAGSLCGAGSALAQEKKVNGKKAAKEAPPPAKLPAVAGEAPIAEPGLLLGAVPGVIPSLEYNYYYPPPGTPHLPQIPAQLYLCPLPYPPPYVGHTYITYPPFQPHEWLWIHRRAYFRVHPDGGATMTSIGWDYH